MHVAVRRICRTAQDHGNAVAADPQGPVLVVLAAQRLPRPRALSVNLSEGLAGRVVGCFRVLGGAAQPMPGVRQSHRPVGVAELGVLVRRNVTLTPLAGLRGGVPGPGRQAGERKGPEFNCRLRQASCGEQVTYGASLRGVHLAKTGRGFHRLRATPPHRLVGPPASVLDSGRHWVTFTTPGSSRSRPSKNPVTTSRVRPT